MKTKIIILLLATVACVGTMSASFDRNNPIEVGDWLYYLDEENLVAEVAGGGGGAPAIVIPSSVSYNGDTYIVTSIGQSAFEEYTNLTSVTIPKNVTNVGAFAFDGCNSLTSVVWNAVRCENAGSIWSNNVAKNITSFTFGDEVEIIPANICFGLEKLTSITIPNSVTIIGYKAFENCCGLTSITIPNGVIEIGKQAFSNCKNVVSLDIPNSVNSIGVYAFRGCEKLTSPIVIPNGIVTIEDAIFSGCKSITSLTIPQSVTRIEGTYVGAFAGCERLEKIFDYRETPANADSKTFDGVDKFNCVLYVPRSSIELYESAAVWRDFYTIEAIEDVQAINDVEVDKNSARKSVRDGHVLIEIGDKSYTIQGQEVK